LTIFMHLHIVIGTRRLKDEAKHQLLIRGGF
jgi:hypothetical protein